MSEAELIAKQQLEIEALKGRVQEFERGVEGVRLILICIGGPLNDNRLQYTRDQLTTFYRIQDALGLD